MMNKVLEVIEARYLFGLAPEQLDVVIHPQSTIHSMVQYRDTSVVAQLGTPDMRVPIAYGLSWPERVVSGAAALDFHALSAMTFESIDDHGHPEPHSWRDAFALIRSMASTLQLWPLSSPPTPARWMICWRWTPRRVTARSAVRPVGLPERVPFFLDWQACC